MNYVKLQLRRNRSDFKSTKRVDLTAYMEIKGYKTPKDEAKWAQFPLKLKILEGKDLIQLGILDVDSVRETKTHSDLAQ